MPLVTLKEILKDTRKEKYAVGAFNFSCYEDAQGIVDGAAALNSPVILSASIGALNYIGLKQTIGMIKGMAESVSIPVCLHLDHAEDLDFIKECIREGFTSVMIDASAKDFETNISETKEIVEYASQYGCSVEAELGMLGGREENIVVADDQATMTNPDDVALFVSATGIDALAVSIGTAHGFYKSEPKIDFERLEKILDKTDCPVVLHGGTGIPEKDFRRCVKMGMGKINVGTEIKYIFSGAVKSAVKEGGQEENDPRKLQGPAKKAVAQFIQGKIEIFGSENKSKQVSLSS